MAKTRLQAGSEIDTLTSTELATTIDQHTRDWYQEKARGVASTRFWGAVLVAGGSIVLPGNTAGDTVWGPRPGQAWRIERITAAGLATGDVVRIYRNAITDSNLVTQCTAANPTAPGLGKGCILRGEERLLAIGTSLTATGYVTLNGEGVEVSESDYYKLV